MSALRVDSQPDGSLRFAVQVSPRASRNQIQGVHDGALKLSLKAPPVEGAANQELVRFLAKALGVPRRALELVHGHAARRKTLQVSGIRREGLDALLRS